MFMGSKRIHWTFSWLFVTSFLVTLSLVNTGQVSAYSGPGAGTTNDPFLIANCVQLQEMEDDLDAYYRLANDIDCSDTANWNGFKGFAPVGNGGDNFTGGLDGNSYAILDLTIIRADDNPGQDAGDESFVGLFGYTNGATLTDIELGSAKIKGLGYVGGIVGYMQGGTLTRSDVNRDVSDNDCNPGHCIWVASGEYGGGLVGLQDGGSISYSSTDGPVMGGGSMLGGLVGSSGGFAQLLNSYAQGNVTGGSNVGGAVGSSSGQSSISLVHATGDVDALNNGPGQGQYAGGLVGYLYNTTIQRSFATGDVHADLYNVGGLIGEITGGAVYDSYASGAVVSETTYAGGLVGTVYDKATIHRTYASGNVTANGATAGGFISEALVTSGDGISIKDSFATGEVTSPASSGAFIANLGSQDITLDDNYYDSYRTTYAHCTGTGMQVSGCSAVNQSNTQPDYFLENSSSPPLNDWDFYAIWTIANGSYPTLDDGADDDGDGMINKIENEGPNGGDANDDGTMDSQQANVYSFMNPYSNTRQVLETDCDLIQVIVVDDPAYETDAQFTYPSGLLSFLIECATPGATATVSIYDYDNENAEKAVLRKSKSGSYSTLSHAYAEVSIGGEMVPKFTYSLADGGEHDEDGDPNGTIIDPVGIAIPVAVTDPDDDSEPQGQATGSGSGQDPTLAETGEPPEVLYAIAIALVSSALIILGYQLKKRRTT